MIKTTKIFLSCFILCCTIKIILAGGPQGGGADATRVMGSLGCELQL